MNEAQMFPYNFHNNLLFEKKYNMIMEQFLQILFHIFFGKFLNFRLLLKKILTSMTFIFYTFHHKNAMFWLFGSFVEFEYLELYSLNNLTSTQL